MTGSSLADDAPKMKLVLLGDSDIAYWPKNEYPHSPSQLGNRDSAVPIQNFGRSGATLADVTTMWRQDVGPSLLSQHKKNGSEDNDDQFFFVLCAGENDVGTGISLDSTIASMEELLRSIFTSGLSIRYVIFLGPKYEPWQKDDQSSKKKYSKMSRSMARVCKRQDWSDRIFYLDSLTLFCGESASIPGAALMGKAQADPKYFASDQLHLSPEGYRIWKEEIDKLLANIREEVY